MPRCCGANARAPARHRIAWSRQPKAAATNAPAPAASFPASMCWRCCGCGSTSRSGSRPPARRNGSTTGARGGAARAAARRASRSRRAMMRARRLRSMLRWQRPRRLLPPIQRLPRAPRPSASASGPSARPRSSPGSTSWSAGSLISSTRALPISPPAPHPPRARCRHGWSMPRPAASLRGSISSRPNCFVSARSAAPISPSSNSAR